MLPSSKPNASSGESLLRKIKAKFLECFGYTTAHGYGRVADAADSRPRRWFWLVACALAFGVFTLQLFDLTLQFMSKPLKTRTWIAHQQVRFVSLSGFNLTVLTVSFIDQVKKYFFPRNLPVNWRVSLNNRGWR